MERYDRQAPCAHSAAEERGRRHKLGELRPRERPARGGARRRSQRRRHRHGRRRPADRPLPDEGYQGRPRAAHGPRRARRHHRRAGQEDAGLRPRGADGGCLGDGDRRSHVRRRPRVVEARARPLLGQPHLGRRRYRGRQVPERERGREPRALLGSSRRWGQFRRSDLR
jgi:hypothetical protein